MGYRPLVRNPVAPAISGRSSVVEHVFPDRLLSVGLCTSNDRLGDRDSTFDGEPRKTKPSERSERSKHCVRPESCWLSATCSSAGGGSAQAEPYVYGTAREISDKFGQLEVIKLRDLLN